MNGGMPSATSGGGGLRRWRLDGEVPVVGAKQRGEVERCREQPMSQGRRGGVPEVGDGIARRGFREGGGVGVARRCLVAADHARRCFIARSFFPQTLLAPKFLFRASRTDANFIGTKFVYLNFYVCFLFNSN